MDKSTDGLSESIIEIVELIKKGKFKEGSLPYIQKALSEKKDNVKNLIAIGIQCAQNGKTNEALTVFCGLSKFVKTNPRIFYNLGIIYSIKKKYQDAIYAYNEALKIDPEDVESLINKGSILNDLKEYESAIDTLKIAIKKNQNYPEAWLNIGIALNNLNRNNESIEAYSKAIDLNKICHKAWSNKSIPLLKSGQLNEALNSCEQALNLNSDYAEAWSNKGNVLHELSRYEEALMSYEQALRLRPDYAQAWFNKGDTCYEIQLYEESLASYEQALRLIPEYAEAWSNKGNVLHELSRYEEALMSYEQALRLRPDYAQAWFNRGSTNQELGRYEEALVDYKQALLLDNKIDWLLGSYLSLKAHIGDWLNFEELTSQLIENIESGEHVAIPFNALSLLDEEKYHHKTAQMFSKKKFIHNPSLGKILKKPKNQKIKVAYFSGDFREHAVAYLTAEIFENHDKTQFEIVGFVWGAIDKDLMTQRIASAFDHFIDVNNMADLQIAKLARDLEIDIAIDLMGYTQNSKPGIFSYRAAPIQCGYIGYLGSMGSVFYDYIIGDKTVIPNENRKYFSEKIIYLPCYQSNDSRRPILLDSKGKECYGIPKEAFVFCCFNSSHKIQPKFFKIWMEILNSVENSVLWLIESNQLFKNNLIIEAEKSGVSQKQIIFAPQVSREEYLRRYQTADLFLDTLPYNAGTTASDALWCGLPILTQVGKSYSGRMAASLLRMLDLQELITHTADEYRNLAIQLARQPEKLKKIKYKLIQSREKSELFDGKIFCKNLESAYKKVYNLYHSGEKFENVEL